MERIIQEVVGFLVFQRAWDTNRHESGPWDGATAECPACGREFVLPPFVSTRPLVRFTNLIRNRVREKFDTSTSRFSISGTRLAICHCCAERLA